MLFEEPDGQPGVPQDECVAEPDAAMGPGAAVGSGPAGTDLDENMAQTGALGHMV